MGASGRSCGARYDGGEFAIVDLADLVSPALEVRKHGAEFVAVQTIAQRFRTLCDGVATGVFAEHQSCASKAHIFGAHDLIGC